MYLLSVFVLFYGFSLVLSEVSRSEITALSEFFFNTNGPTWRVNYGWNSLMHADGPISNPCGSSLGWYGVKCTSDGKNIQSMVLKDNNLTSVDNNTLKLLSNLTFLTTLDMSNTNNVDSFRNRIAGDISDICLLSSKLETALLTYNLISGSLSECIGTSLLSVTALEIGSNLIHGSIPHAICSLSNLQVLSLSMNMLSGSIPSCIGSCHSLTFLEISNIDVHGVQGSQMLSGSIPSSVCNLTQLEEIDFTWAGLGGSIPSCLGLDQPGFQLMYMAHNKLTGTIPPALCSPRSLLSIQLIDNSLSGHIPSCFGESSSPLLFSLQLYGNSMSGSISESLCNLKKMVQLDLSENRFYGTLPSCLGHLPLVKNLIFNVNSLHGTIPRSFCSLNSSGILYLDLSDNQLSGEFPRDCFDATFTTLQALALSNNHFTGIIPESLCEVLSLEIITIYGNDLTGSIPDCLGELNSLIWFIATANRLTGSIPMSICELSELEVLDIFGNSLTGVIPNCIGQLSHLESIFLNDNYLSGTLPQSVGDLSELQVLAMENNQFKGHIPTEYGKLSKLYSFKFSQNLLSGTLSNMFCNLHNLLYLEVFGNHLHGSIPACFGNSFPVLESMLLQDNNFHGSLPNTWSLNSLVALVLSNNKLLSGTIPSSLFLQRDEASSDGVINALAYIVIEGTRLSGSIPSSVSAAIHLNTLLLSGNLLTGSIPSSMVNLQYLEMFRAPHNKLMGHLMPNINNMSALSTLDLSRNHLSGTVPGALGDMSEQLIETNLILNHLSCDLPQSVLEWEKAPRFNKMEILEGNLFSCPEGGLFGLSMISSQSSGLVSANRESAQFYSCGGSAYVIPLALPLSIIGMLMCVTAYCYVKKLAGFSEKGCELYIISRKLCDVDGVLNEAFKELRYLHLSIVVIGLIAMVVVFPLLLSVHSVYSCQYAARITLSSKDGNKTIFAIIIGSAVGLGIVFGSSVYWKVLFRRTGQVIEESIESLSCPLVENETMERTMKMGPSQSFSDDDCDSLDFHTQASDSHPPADKPVLFNDLEKEDPGLDHSDCSSASDDFFNNRSAKPLPAFYFLVGIKLASLFVFISGSVVLPNVTYVVVIIGKYSYKLKLACIILICALKITISNILVPVVADRTAMMIYPKASQSSRYRFTLNVTVFISALSLIIIPVMIVGVTDERCLYFAFSDENKITSDVSYEVCALYSSDVDKVNAGCSQYETTTIQSTYTPKFEYDGSQCVSAILSTYAPVFLTFVLLSAPLSAMMDLLVVPLCVPWCFHNQRRYSTARWLLVMFRSITWNIPSVVTTFCESTESLNEMMEGIDIDVMSYGVMRRAFIQFSGTLLVALTFGLAAPVIGIACICASLIQFKHHSIAMSQIVRLGEVMPIPKIPSLVECKYPAFASGVVVMTTILFWCSMAISNLDEFAASMALVSVVALSLLLLFLFVSKTKQTVPLKKGQKTLGIFWRVLDLFCPREKRKVQI